MNQVTFRDLRIKTGLSQSKLALKIGITSSAVNQYEKGKRTPDVPTLIKLAKTLNVSIDEIVRCFTEN